MLMKLKPFALVGLLFLISCGSNNQDSEAVQKSKELSQEFERLPQRGVFFPTEVEVSNALRKNQLAGKVIPAVDETVSAETLIDGNICGDLSLQTLFNVGTSLPNVEDVDPQSSEFTPRHSAHFMHDFEKLGDTALWYLASFRSIVNVQFGSLEARITDLEDAVFSDGDKSCVAKNGILPTDLKGTYSRNADVISTVTTERSEGNLDAAHIVQVDETNEQFVRMISFVPQPKLQSISVLVFLLFDPQPDGGITDYKSLLNSASSVSRELRVSWQLKIDSLMRSLEE